MKGLVETLLEAEDQRPLFLRGEHWVTAAHIRAMAANAASKVAQSQAPLYLHTRSAAHFTAGLLSAAILGRPVALPAHVQPAYLAEIGCPAEVLLADDAFDAGCDHGPFCVAARDPLLVFFTSGSTGSPKPVEKNLSRLETETRAIEALWGRDASHVLGTVSHQHIYGLLFRLMWPLMAGRTGDDEPAVYWEDLEGRFQGATLVSSPAHLTRLPPRPDIFAHPPALVFSSGQLLPAEAAAACRKTFGRPVAEVLGSTETGGIAWRRQTDSDTPWTPFDRIEVTEGVDGALVVRSPYLQRPEPHETGDGVLLLADGRFRLKARGDRLVKVDGKRVSLTRVEQALDTLAEVDTSAALTLPARRDALAAIVVLTKAGCERLAKEGAFRLSRYLRGVALASLEAAERPKHWRFVEAIPTDSQGKRVISTLRALFSDADPLEPLELDVRNLTDTDAEVAFTLTPELVFFEGHFPERQILPGVAQAHLAVLIAERLWGSWPSDANLARLKFRRVLSPNDHVVLRLKRDLAIGRVAFRFDLAGVEVTHGEIGGFT